MVNIMFIHIINIFELLLLLDTILDAGDKIIMKANKYLLTKGLSYGFREL